ncbi:YggS family pyridoxal phosphate-dependent enzyme [Zooshikella harenae]|uniref:Pyridoxal phosphate homeostasis protein n=1 Tax=Zooshikella harenae TaxID=2827238 RepID=A0ABS5Z8A1_9GAMM|nr:YggS family pyridoxal phosphate-dependent enzyme [Zooshikella harenae]MBU2709515.1 YggS family pyridoxal phosphate-dependent enzyme [Zooshikella harenae]
MSNIANNLQAIRQRISTAQQLAGRSENDVQLLAVSKNQPLESLEEAYAAGQTLFGENYLQEALLKISKLSHLDISWHFIGPIQSNKTKTIAQHFSWVHSVDRLKIAQRLNNARLGMVPLNICIQVNISEEPSKSGVLLDQLEPLAAEILQLSNLSLRGLMAIPLASADPIVQQQQFHRLAQALKHLQHTFPEAKLDTLSMGMSNDMEVAIKEGATIVRIGTALFGARK